MYNCNWTSKEEEMIVKIIAKYPQNLEYGYEEAAKKISRTAVAVRKRFGQLRDENPELITVLSGETSFDGRKNVAKNKIRDNVELTLAAIGEMIEDMTSKLTSTEAEKVKQQLPSRFKV